MRVALRKVLLLEPDCSLPDDLEGGAAHEEALGSSRIMHASLSRCS